MRCRSFPVAMRGPPIVEAPSLRRLGTPYFVQYCVKLDAVCHENHPNGSAHACRARRACAGLCTASPVVPASPAGDEPTAAPATGAVRPLEPRTSAPAGSPISGAQARGRPSDGAGAPGGATQPAHRQLGPGAHSHGFTASVRRLNVSAPDASPLQSPRPRCRTSACPSRPRS